MKKLLSLAAVSVLSLGAAACSGNTNYTLADECRTYSSECEGVEVETVETTTTTKTNKVYAADTDKKAEKAFNYSNRK